jgi:hypothetical protein
MANILSQDLRSRLIAAAPQQPSAKEATVVRIASRPRPDQAIKAQVDITLVELAEMLHQQRMPRRTTAFGPAGKASV